MNTTTSAPLVANVSTTTTAQTPASTVSTATTLDTGFIVALVCFGIGGILLIVGFIKVLCWYIDSKKHEKYSKWWLRQLEHRRHLEEYSIRTGDVASHYSGSVHSLANHGFTHEEEEEEDEFRGQRGVDPEAASPNDIDLSVNVNASETNLRKSDTSVNNTNRQDKNMNEIMDYL